MLASGNLKAVSENMPSRITQVTKEPPICDVIKITGQGAVVRFVEFELVRLSSLLSVGGNLNDSQVQFIATKLVEMFPNESLADFKLCFERGCVGQYGEIYRMDGIVLRRWMEQYLDEKYQVIEDELMKEKDELHKKVTPENGKDWYQVWLDSVGEDKKPAPLTDDDIRKEGQVKPRKSEYIPNADNVKEHQEKLNRARAAYFREHYPDASEEEIQAYILKFDSIDNPNFLKL